MLVMDCKRRGYVGHGFDMGWRDGDSTDHGYREDLFINVTLIELFLSPRIARIMRGKFCFLLINIYCDTRGNSRGGFMVNVITLIKLLPAEIFK